MVIVAADEFNITDFSTIPIQKRKRNNQTRQREKEIKYKDVITCFDIETTRIQEIEQSIMYIWQWQIGDQTVIGRTWDDFLKLALSLCATCSENEYIVVFVHNLSYEWQFLRGIYNFAPEEVFALQARKIAKCQMFGHLEFRCSYIHSNMGLAKYCESMGVEHRKLSGEEFDYSKIRYPWTAMTDRELEYCVNDVLGLSEAIRNQMQRDGDNLYTFPLTSTGYVRRDAKRAMRSVSHNLVPDMLPDFEQYTMLREAFRGGDTHANRYYAGLHLKSESCGIIHSADRSSSYPDVMCNCLMPMSRWKSEQCSNIDDIEELMHRGRAVLMRVAMLRVKLKDEMFGCPYLAVDKCRNIQSAEDAVNEESLWRRGRKLKRGYQNSYDNGRILIADYLETTITDVDYRIIKKEYDVEVIKPLEVYSCRYGKLPVQFTDLVEHYYIEKTRLKGVEDMEYFYNKSKNLLNSLYGMTAQNPVNQSIIFDEDPETGLLDFILDESKSAAELLEASNKRAFLTYAWGVWVTAWARYRLHEAIWLVFEAELRGEAAFLYCDTDSVKYIGNVDFTAYNKERIRSSIDSRAYADDPAGVRHYMGVLEDDGAYTEFSTLGAKKYCYRDMKGKLHVTIAGVNKKAGAAELERAGGIKAFHEGFIFRDAGGTESLYNDYPDIRTYIAEGRELLITSNVVIRESTYMLGISGDYDRLLHYIDDADLRRDC